MAIDTTNEKLAVMEWEEYYEPAIPLSPGAFGTDDKQQLLWGYPGVAWTPPPPPPVARPSFSDLRRKGLTFVRNRR